MSERKTSLKPCEVPGSASVEDGLVVLDGPDGVAVTMTAEAARRTGSSLLAAAAQASGVPDAADDPAGSGRPGQLPR